MSTPHTERKKRASRDFYISIQQKPTPQKEDDPKQKARKTKPTKTSKSETTLIDDFTKLLDQKFGHWALVVEAYPSNHADSQNSQRFIEICTKHTEGTVSDSDQSDRYEDDEEEGLPTPGGFPHKLGVRIGRAPKVSNPPKENTTPRPERRFEEPDYDTLGGVCWQLLTKLKSRTRFTNSEIRKEAERIWRRQADYRLLDNNCQRFCILLAIHIRAKQSTFLRLLHAKTVKKQLGSTEKVVDKGMRALLALKPEKKKLDR